LLLFGCSLEYKIAVAFLEFFTRPDPTRKSWLIFLVQLTWRNSSWISYSNCGLIAERPLWDPYTSTPYPSSGTLPIGPENDTRWNWTPGWTKLCANESPRQR